MNATPGDSGLCLVTGATGFVGSTLVERLVSRGVRVRAFVRPSSDVGHLLRLGTELFRGDLADAASLARAVEGVLKIYHLGDVGMRVPGAGRKNVAAVAELARAAAAQPGFRRLVFLSSLTTVSVPARLPADEETPVDPDRIVDDYYTRYKRECEAVLRRAGIPVSVVRAGAIRGPGGHYLRRFARFCARLRIVPCPGRLDIRLAGIHVADLAAILEAAGDVVSAPYREFHAVDDAGGSVGDFLDLLVRSAGTRARFYSPPVGLQRVTAALLDPLLALRLPGRNLRAIVEYMSFDQNFANRRIKEELGITLRHPSWEGKNSIL